MAYIDETGVQTLVNEIKDYADQAYGGVPASGSIAYIVIQNRSSSDTVEYLLKDNFYIYPEMTTLTINCPNEGMCGLRFTSGTTATDFTINNAIMPDGFTVEANKIYEINILNGYGVYTSWSVST